VFEPIFGDQYGIMPKLIYREDLRNNASAHTRTLSAEGKEGSTISW
jgi:hypothetical protein